MRVKSRDYVSWGELLVLRFIKAFQGINMENAIKRGIFKGEEGRFEF